MKRIFISSLIAIVAMAMQARDFTYQDVTYTVLDEDARTCEVKAGDYKTPGAIAPDYSGAIILPSNPKDSDGKTYTLVSLGKYAFFYGGGLTSVTIPNSVTSIGDYAFLECYGLVSVTIPNSVTSIGDSAFCGCGGLTKAEFASIESLCKIEFGNSDANPLYYAHNLYINGQEIKDLVIPNSVTSIGERTFYGCRGLTSVTISSSVTSIGDYAFHGCEGLMQAEFASIESLCKIEFGNSNANPLSYAHNLYINGQEIKDLVIPGSVTSIGKYAFNGCRGLTSVTIPNSVTSIGDYVFSGCHGLTSVTIPNFVTSIGDGAFYECRGLTSVTIPNSVTSIGRDAFSGCSGLTSVTIPNSVTSIGEEAFYSSGLTSVTIPNSVTSIGKGAFLWCSGLTSVTINSATSIGDSAFRDCSSLTSVAIPNSVTSIGDGAFYECSGLTSVTIPNSVTSIGEWAFYYCGALTSIAIPNSVTSIGTRAFLWCSGLTSVTIPNSVTSIAEAAFYGCSDLTSVYYSATEPISGYEYTFSDYDRPTLYVPAEAVVKCKTIDPWKKFSKIEAYDFSGIELVHSDLDWSKPHDVYDINGVMVGSSTENLAPGIYIVRQGNAVNKIAVK